MRTSIEQSREGKLASQSVKGTLCDATYICSQGNVPFYLLMSRIILNPAVRHGETRNRYRTIFRLMAVEYGMVERCKSHFTSASQMTALPFR